MSSFYLIDLDIDKLLISDFTVMTHLQREDYWLMAADESAVARQAYVYSTFQQQGHSKFRFRFICTI